MAHGRSAGVYLCRREPGDSDQEGDAELDRWSNEGGREPPPAKDRYAPEPLGDEALGDWCRVGGLQMAFLQVCQAAQTRKGGAFGGLAQVLLSPRQGDLAAVVASCFPLLASPSTEAAARFYEQLARGASPDEALDRDRTEEADWTWAYLELWARPLALPGTGPLGLYQFVPPYRGLNQFDEEHHEIFFGRGGKVQRLLDQLRDQVALAVQGESGSGKSSLLHAGLAYRIRVEGLGGKTAWDVVSVTPGDEPAQRLLDRLAALAHPPGTNEDGPKARWGARQRRPGGSVRPGPPTRADSRPVRGDFHPLRRSATACRSG